MVLGYDEKRPEKINYMDFDIKLVNGLRELGIEGLSLILYGSHVRNTYTPGRSDVDAMLIFPDDVVTDKHNISLCSKVLSDSLEGNNIPFQVSVCDLATMKDGRFNTYDPSFQYYFKEEAVTVLGPNYLPEFKYELPTITDLGTLRFNLRRVRNGLLFSEHNMNNDYKAFLEDFHKSLGKVADTPRKIFKMAAGKLQHKERFTALARLREEFPEVDMKPLEIIKDLFSNTAKLDTLYRYPSKILEFWNHSVTTMEQIIKGYMQRNPRH